MEWLGSDECLAHKLWRSVRIANSAVVGESDCTRSAMGSLATVWRFNLTKPRMALAQRGHKRCQLRFHHKHRVVLHPVDVSELMQKSVTYRVSRTQLGAEPNESALAVLSGGFWIAPETRSPPLPSIGIL